MIGPDQLKICDINPLDYRTIKGKKKKAKA